MCRDEMSPEEQEISRNLEESNDLPRRESSTCRTPKAPTRSEEGGRRSPWKFEDPLLGWPSKVELDQVPIR